MNPLDIILEWFTNQEQEYKLELIALAAHFHPDAELMQEMDEVKRIERFEKYLDPSGLPIKEVLTRTFIMKGLIGFSLAGKDTEFDWEEKKNENLAALEDFRKQGFADNPASEFLQNYPKSKKAWIEWASDWHVTNEVSISGDGLREWYIDYLKEKTHQG